MIRVPSTAQVSVSKTLGRTSACSTVPVSEGSRLRTTPCDRNVQDPAADLGRSGATAAAGAAAFPTSA